MAKDLKISTLIDVYGDTLTQKQRDVIDLYYNEDLSLAEIAEHEGITRQGVRDSIKRGEAILTELEQKLGLAKLVFGYSKLLDNIKELAEDIYDESATYNYSRIITDKAKEIVDKINETDKFFD